MRPRMAAGQGDLVECPIDLPARVPIRAAQTWCAARITASVLSTSLRSGGRKAPGVERKGRMLIMVQGGPGSAENFCKSTPSALVVRGHQRLLITFNLVK